MTSYVQPAPCAERDLDISRWLWDLWERPAVKAWLKTSLSKRQVLKRMEVAMRLYRNTLWWAMSRALFPSQQLHGLEPRSSEEFCWEGIAPTAEAERHILELAATEGNDWIEKVEDPERLRELLMSQWTMRHPVAWYNRYLFSPELLGDGADELIYGW